MVRSKEPDIALEEIPLHKFVFREIEQYGDNIALVNAVNGRNITYRDFPKLCRSVASGLYRHGVRKGDVIAVLSSNNPAYGVYLFGAMMAGAVSTTVNPAYTMYEVGRQLTDSRATYIYTMEGMVDLAKKAASRVNTIKKIFVLGQAEGCVSFRQLLQDDGSACPDDLTFDPKQDVVFLPYSSGTTGLPKGVMLTHYNIVSNLLQVEVVRVQSDAQSTVLCILPFFHSYGLSVILVGGLFRGNKLVIQPRFEPKSFLEAIQKYKVTDLALVPPIVVFLAKHPMVLQYDLSSIQRVGCGAAPLTKDTEQQFEQRIKLTPTQGYGLTETSPVVIAPIRDQTKPGSSGALLPNTEARIVDPTTKEDLGVNQRGEIWIRGPQVMKGYLNNPQATRGCIDSEGWFHTGDVAYYDEEGYFYIVDRIKELIKYKGFQVAPAELEALLINHPSVSEAAVIGIPDVNAGEVPKAFVVKKPDVNITADDIHAFVKGHAASFKQLRGGIEFVSEIPKSPSGKILRRLIRDKQMKSKI